MRRTHEAGHGPERGGGDRRRLPRRRAGRPDKDVPRRRHAARHRPPARRARTWRGVTPGACAPGPRGTGRPRGRFVAGGWRSPQMVTRYARASPSRTAPWRDYSAAATLRSCPARERKSRYPTSRRCRRRRPAISARAVTRPAPTPKITASSTPTRVHEYVGPSLHASITPDTGAGLDDGCSRQPRTAGRTSTGHVAGGHVQRRAVLGFGAVIEGRARSRRHRGKRARLARSTRARTSRTSTSPSLTAVVLSYFGISSLRRQECSSGTTNARKPGKWVGQMVVLRTPPGCGSMPSAS